MRAVVYTETGESSVLHVVDRPAPEPGPGKVRVAVRVSGVNPTDWKARRGQMAFPEQVPNQDGAGVIDAVGAGVDRARVGERVWLWEAAWHRADGTAQDLVVLPSRQAVPLPDPASFELGACLGIPVLTAHRCLTVADGGPVRLAAGALAGRVVLAAGGAGAVGNATIQLARWAGATVIATVSSADKAALATAAGAQHVVNYREGDPAASIRAIAPGGVDIIVEVSPSVNAGLDGAVLAPNGVIAMYASDAGGDPVIPLGRAFALNVRWQGVLVYTVAAAAKDHGVAAIGAALNDGALRIGPEAGLPLHRFPLERTADAHDAVEHNVVGKVLVNLG
jgi:NADPH2:quinone reductase